MPVFGLGAPELIFLLALAAVVLFFGKDKVKEWFKIGHEIKNELKQTTKTNAEA